MERNSLTQQPQPMVLWFQSSFLKPSHCFPRILWELSAGHVTRVKFNKDYLKHPTCSSATFFSESLKRKSVISFTYELLLDSNMRFWSHNLQLWEREPFHFCCALLSFSFINMNSDPIWCGKRNIPLPPQKLVFKPCPQ